MCLFFANNYKHAEYSWFFLRIWQFLKCTRIIAQIIKYVQFFRFPRQLFSTFRGRWSQIWHFYKAYVQRCTKKIFFGFHFQNKVTKICTKIHILGYNYWNFTSISTRSVYFCLIVNVVFEWILTFFEKIFLKVDIFLDYYILVHMLHIKQHNVIEVISEFENSQGCLPESWKMWKNETTALVISKTHNLTFWPQLSITHPN